MEATAGKGVDSVIPVLKDYKSAVSSYKPHPLLKGRMNFDFALLYLYCAIDNISISIK